MNNNSVLKSMGISGKTQICGIIGDPIEHTISPAMQNAAFQKAELDYIYVPFKVGRGDLEQAVYGIRALNIRGVNVTIPHKIAIIPFLDELDPLARKIGAVNTIVNEGGSLKGYNTDAAGFLQALQAEKVKTEKKKIVVIGAGGAARSITFALADKGSSLTIINRHFEAAQNLADWIFSIFRTKVKSQELNEENLRFDLDETDMVINATSIGMVPQIDETPIPGRLLRPGLIVFDIIYNPLKTRLLSEAEKQGARVIGGMEMLVQQGAAAFELWSGRKAPLEQMRSAAIKAMEKNED